MQGEIVAKQTFSGMPGEIVAKKAFSGMPGELIVKKRFSLGSDPAVFVDKDVFAGYSMQLELMIIDHFNMLIVILITQLMAE